MKLCSHVPRCLGRYWPALFAALLGACSSTGPQVLPTPLEPLTTSLSVTRDWINVQAVELERHGARLPVSVHDGRIYWIDGAGTVHALDAVSGTKLWKYDTERAAGSPVGGGIEGLVFVATRDATVIALDAQTGRLRWQEQVSSEAVAPPQGNRAQVVVVHTVDGRVHALAAETGQPMWNFESSVPSLSLRGTATPVIDGDRVIVGLASGKVAALSVWDGALRWRAELATPTGRSELERMVDVDTTPRLVDDTLFAAAFQGRIAAMAPATGHIRWSRDVSSSQEMAVDDERVYLADSDGVLWSYFQRNGTVAWRQDALKGRTITGPVVYGDYLVVGDFEGYLHWVERSGGHIVHRERLDDQPIGAAPVTDGERLYVGTRSGVIYAMRLAR